MTDEHRAMMNDLVRRLRGMADAAGKKRGRPMLVMIRVPDSVAYSASIGLDLAAWCREGLVDILVGGGYFVFEPWENLVNKYFVSQSQGITFVFR